MNSVNPTRNTLRAAVGTVWRYFVFWISVLALAIEALFLVGCQRESRNDPAAAGRLPTARIEVRTAETRNRVVTEEVVGTVRAKVRTTLEAKISGRISEIPVLLGQAIKAGDLIARLAAPEIQARLEQAQANLQLSERDWKRTSELFSQQAITRSDYDAADSRYRVAKAAVAEAQAMSGYLEVLAPFSGVVTKKWAEVGDLAAPGKPLVELENQSALQLEADIPETIAPAIQLGARLAVRLDPMAGECFGTVAEIAPAADPVSRTFRVKLDLANPPQPKQDELTSSETPAATPRFSRACRPGQFARLAVPVGENASLEVPDTAIVQRGQLDIVFVVSNQHASLHLVKIGRRFGHQVEILAGLDPGDQLVTEGAALLVDGQPVEPK